MTDVDKRIFAVDVTRNRERTIVLGPIFAKGNLPDGRSVDIVGSGTLLRISFFGDGERKEYDINLGHVVSSILREEQTNEF